MGVRESTTSLSIKYLEDSREELEDSREELESFQGRN